MEAFQEWIYRILYLVVFLNMVVALVHKESYGKYLRIVAGWLLTLYVMVPLLDFFGNGAMAWPEFSVTGEEEEADSAEFDACMQSFYEQGLERQLLRFIRSKEYEPVAVRVTISGKEENMSITGLYVVISAGQDTSALKEILVSYYRIPEDVIKVTVPQ